MTQWRRDNPFGASFSIAAQHARNTCLGASSRGLIDEKELERVDRAIARARALIKMPPEFVETIFRGHQLMTEKLN